MDRGGPSGMLEAAVVETEVASGAARAWTAVALVVEDEVVLGGPLDH